MAKKAKQVKKAIREWVKGLTDEEALELVDYIEIRKGDEIKFSAKIKSLGGPGSGPKCDPIVGC